MYLPDIYFDSLSELSSDAIISAQLVGLEKKKEERRRKKILVYFKLRGREFECWSVISTWVLARKGVHSGHLTELNVWPVVQSPYIQYSLHCTYAHRAYNSGPPFIILNAVSFEFIDVTYSFLLARQVFFPTCNTMFLNNVRCGYLVFSFKH